MTNLTKSRRQFTAQQKQEAVELCLSEGLSCRAVAQRLGIPISSLAKWVRQVRIDRGDFSPPDRDPLKALFHGLALPAAGCGPQRFLRLAATAAKPRPTGPAERCHHNRGAGGV